MAERIKEDIRFYLPSDPYYYQVDNLPLQDLLDNDIKLQDQLDALTADAGTTVYRDGIRELQPWINAALPGTISVRAGNFIGRVQRTAGDEIAGATVNADGDGVLEMDTPPTTINNYNVNNPPTGPKGGTKYVGRTAVFNFPGGEIDIDGFDFEGFEWDSQYTPPLGRLDLIGITTVNGAMDDPYLPGNPTGTGVEVGDGLPKLAVVKGAGLVTATQGTREVVTGEKYITIGLPQEELNDYGRNLNGGITPNPTYGTIPSPDDVVNICFSDPDVNSSLTQFAQNNRNASFFLPLGYVYVSQSHVAGNPLPEGSLKDIRPFFRTAELTLAERQSIATAYQPSHTNRMVTQSHLDATFTREINRTSSAPTIQAQLDQLRQTLGRVEIPRFVNLSEGGQIVSTGVTTSETGLKVYLDDVINRSTNVDNISRASIQQVQMTIFNNSRTGDINYTAFYAKGEGMTDSWMRCYAYGLDNHGTTHLYGPLNSFMIKPMRESDGRLYVLFKRSGNSVRISINVNSIVYNESVDITL